MIITIDGAAGTGKSTVAKKVAELLHIAYFDTGAMYRAFAYFVIEKAIDFHHEQNVSSLVEYFDFNFEGIGSHKIYYVNGKNVTSIIRTPHVTEVSSIISQYPKVRQALHQIQKKFAENRDCIFEGRDLGTVIFPDADFKFFLNASDEVRANRRHQEMMQKGISVSYEDVLSSIQERDHRDKNREVAPLKRADDAIEIDTSDLNIDQVVEKIILTMGST